MSKIILAIALMLAVTAVTAIVLIPMQPAVAGCGGSSPC
jgi:hypothetical protein